MVRLINKNNKDKIVKLVLPIMKLQDKLTYIAEFNNPDKAPCVYVMWHGNQFCVHGIPERNKLNILISNSIDGEIISSLAEGLGYKTCRGSSKRKGAVSASLKLISKLKDGESVAIMVDGPQGPIYSVKSGAIVLAREAGVPIVPVNWYSPNPTFIHIASWDKMTTPMGPCWLLNTYGAPIYPENKSDEEVAEEIKNSLMKLLEEAPEKYKEAKKLKLWNKKK